MRLTPLSPKVQPARSGRVVSMPIVLLIAALLLPSAALAATGPAISAPSSADAGRWIEVKGTAFDPRASVNLAWNGSTSGMPKARADSLGAFVVNLRVPLDASAGTHQIQAFSAKGGRSIIKRGVQPLASTTIQVIAATATVSPTPTPTAAPKPSPTPTPAPTPTSAPTPTPTPTPTPAPAEGCSRIVAAGGSVQAAVDASSSGNVICLRGGTYSGFTVSKSGLTITSYPGETATIRGQTVVRGVSSGTIRNLSLTGATSTFQAGLRVDSSSGVKVSGNRMAGNSLGLFLFNARSALVENNVVTDNAYGIEVHGATDGTIIRSNRVDENDRYLDPARSAGGINFHKTSGGIIVSDNTFFGNNEVAIEIYAASNITLTRNSMTGSNDLIETGTESGLPCDNLRIVRNVGWNSSIGSGGEERGFYLRCASNSIVAHNVLDGMDRFAFGIYSASGRYSGPIDSLRLLNNIGANGRVYSIDSTLPSSVVIDYNLATTAAGPVFGGTLAYVYGKGNTSSWDQFRSWTGYDAHGVSANPAFVDRANRDYRLSSGSPAVDRGTILNGWNDTYLGSAPDMGRYER
jgi:parallel beta-helix repeat protein